VRKVWDRRLGALLKKGRMLAYMPSGHLIANSENWLKHISNDHARRHYLSVTGPCVVLGKPFKVGSPVQRMTAIWELATNTSWKPKTIWSTAGAVD
jgi:hypothetical protein